MKDSAFIKFSLLSLLILSTLLPFGIFGGITSGIFLAAFTIHLSLLLLSVFDACRVICKQICSTSVHLRYLILTAVFLSLIFCASSLVLPVTARDALIHHLAIPKLWIQNNQISSIAWHEWSFYPMLIQLSFTALLQIGPEQLCSVYVFLYLPLFLASSIKLSVKLSARQDAGDFALFLGLLLPAVLKLSSVPLVDLPLAFLCATALILVLEDSKYKSAGLAFGLALSCKLNAIPFFIFTLLAVLSAQAKSLTEFKRAAKSLTAIGILAILVYSPWLIKNYFWSGNPLYPYINWIFPAGIEKPVSGLSGLNPLLQRIMLYGESIPEVILLPLRIFIQGQDNNPALFDGVLSPLLLIGLLFGLWHFKDSAIRQITIVSLAFIIFCLLSTAARVRYLAPVYAPLIALSATAFAHLFTVSKAAKYFVALCLLFQLVFSSIYLFKNNSLTASYHYFSGGLSRSDYLSAQIPEYPLIEYCNNHLPKNSRVYLIYTGNQFYLYNTAVFSSGHTSADQLLAWIKASGNAEDLSSKFRQSGITHLLVNEERLLGILQTSLNPEAKQIWNNFFNQQLTPLRTERGFSIFAVK